jgi:hypothetical protein
MAQSIEYRKVMSEIVYINLPGPEEPAPGMTGGELLHGYLTELYRKGDPEAKRVLSELCGKWNIYYRPANP